MNSLLIVLLISSPSFAAAKKKAIKTVPNTTQITVQFGDRYSQFKFIGKKMDFNNNAGRHSTVDLSEKDQKFLMGMIDDLQKQQAHEKRFCPNKYATLTKSGKSVISCLDSGTKLGQDTRDLVNTLSMML